MKTGVQGREVFPLETKQNNPETFGGFRVSGFLIKKKKKNPEPSQIYEKQTLSIENGFIEKQFSVKNQFWQGSFSRAQMLDARNKYRHLALKGRVARVKDFFRPRGDIPQSQEWPVTDQKG